MGSDRVLKCGLSLAAAGPGGGLRVLLCSVDGGADNEVLSAQLKRLEAALAREVKVATALREVGSALGTTLDLDELLELILGRLTDVLEADRSTLYLLDTAKGELVSRIVIGGQVRSIRVRVGHGIAGTVAKTGQVIRLRDAYQDPRFEPEWDLFTGYRTRSMLAAPLKNHMGRIIGVIQVLNKRSAAAFTDEDEALLSALSTQAAVAIDNTRLFLSLIQKNHQLLSTKEKLERRVADLQLLNELESAMARAPSLDELAAAVLLPVVKACQSQGGTLLLVEEESGDLMQYFFDPDAKSVMTHLRVKSGEGLAASVLSRNEALEVEDASRLPEFSASVEGTLRFAVTSCLMMPLGGGAEPLGALGLFTKKGGRSFEEEDRALLEVVCSNVSTALRLFRASEQRERGQRLTTIGRLLAQIVHDFRTPMAVISGRVQLMATEPSEEVRREHVSAILKQFRALTSMQREVLEFARGERGIFVRRVVLWRFFQELAEQAKDELAKARVTLVLQVDPKGTARFDEMRLARAIQNLVRNAIEAMSNEGGQLTIRAMFDQEDLVIEVADTGPGIPEEIRGRLFQSFVTARKEGGTGLGLAIVKKIVEEHRGSIELIPAVRGACFALRLPQGAQVQSLLPPAPDATEESELEL